MSTFLIVGYPRSRTAWLANLLCTGQVMCGHEMLAHHRPSELPLAMASLGGEINGNADTYQIFEMDRILPLLEEPRIVVVRRDMDCVFRSMLTLGLGNAKVIVDGLKATRPYLDRAASMENAMQVDFDELDEERTCKRIWQFVTQDKIPWNRQRWNVLQAFNVQVSSKRHGELKSLAEQSFRL